MHTQVQFQRFIAFFMMILFLPNMVFAAVPLLRLKTGFSSLTVNAGQRVQNGSLTPMITFQPSVTWEVPEFSSRIGVHYLQDIGGAYGMTPVQGLGISGYYHIFGLSSSYRLTEDGVSIQKSKPGLYLFGSLTPVNFNLNSFTEDGVNNDFNLSAVVFDLSTGVGFDYPLSQNMVMSAEFTLRNASGASQTGSTGQNLDMNYRGYTLYFSFATSYF